MSKILNFWNGFFFKPISSATIGLFRIVLGLVILDSLIGKFPDRELFYGDKGLITSKTIGVFFQNLSPSLQTFKLVPSADPQLLWFFLALLLLTVFLILGLFTRISSILVFIGLLAIDNRNLFAGNAGDELLRINSFFLIFSEAGAAFSLDRWIRVKRGLEGPEWPLKSPWAQRVLQLQLAYVYLDTIFLKAHGASWRDGTAMYYALNYAELKRFEMKWLFYYLWEIKLATWGTLAIEASMFSMVWFRKFRYWCLGAALILHLGINLTMQFPIFQYVMIASLVTFIYPEDVEKAWGRIRAKVSP